jgi:hypothetical protein
MCDNKLINKITQYLNKNNPSSGKQLDNFTVIRKIAAAETGRPAGSSLARYRRTLRTTVHACRSCLCSESCRLFQFPWIEKVLETIPVPFFSWHRTEKNRTSLCHSTQPASKPASKTRSRCGFPYSIRANVGRIPWQSLWTLSSTPSS